VSCLVIVEKMCAFLVSSIICSCSSVGLLSKFSVSTKGKFKVVK